MTRLYPLLASALLASSLLTSTVLASTPALSARTALATISHAPTASPSQQTTSVLRGLSLREALEILRSQGLDLLFSNRLVTDRSRVLVEPPGDSPEQQLLAILLPHGLTARQDQESRWVVVRSKPQRVFVLRGKVVDRRSGRALANSRVSVRSLELSTLTDEQGRFALTATRPGLFQLKIEAAPFPDRVVSAKFRPNGETNSLRIEMDLPVVPLEEIIVTPSAYGISHSEPVTTIGISRDERDALPIPGDDVFRTAATFSGTAAGDFSAQFFPRGGREDEVLVLLDGLELYEPYHLKDLDSALSLVAPQSVDSLELRIGGFSAAYGDKISGLLDMTTVRPASQPAGHLGVSPIDFSATLGDATRSGVIAWFLSGRRGLLRETLKLTESEERPAFSDVFAKLEWQPTGRHTLRLEGLDAKDDSKIRKTFEDTSSIYQTNHLWALHTGILGQKTLVTSTAFYGRVDENRVGEGTEPGRLYSASDQRNVDVYGVDQRWNTQLSPRQSLKWGWSVREIETLFDYRLSLNLEDPLAGLRTQPAKLENRFRAELHGRQGSTYGSYRFSLAERLTVETGLRFEESHVIDDEHLSPRLLAAFSFTDRTVLRASWGYYYQSLRSHELLVEDGETTFPADEVAKKTVLGIEHVFANNLRMRIEAYERRVEDPRLRYVNLFDQVTPFPEVGFDRVRLDATQSRARGVEVAFQGHGGGNRSWRASYALSRSRDRLEGPSGATVATPRFFDQTHAVRFAWSHTIRQHWNINLNAQIHTGWPTSEITLQSSGDQQYTPTVEINQDRLPTYRRLDLALRRDLQSRWGQWTFSLEVLNVLGRGNLRGFEVELDDQGVQPVIDKEDLQWAGRTPSFSVRLRF